MTTDIEFPASVEAIRRIRQDPHRLGHRDHGGAPVPGTGQGETGPASRRILVGFGFWIFLISDIVMFSCFFATYAVLQGATAGGPKPYDLFSDTTRVAIETAALLLSSFVCGLSFAATNSKNVPWTQIFLLITGLLGLVFLVLEITEFAELVAKGATPQRSAFLTAFYTLVGCHGVHVGAGLLWLGTMMAQIQIKGFRREIIHRLICFNLFWHALDIIWVAIFTIVYLMGSIPS
jgi:cytochrome o ubiquinol oxidase subunit 3